MDVRKPDWIVVLKQNLVIMVTDVFELNSFFCLCVCVCACVCARARLCARARVRAHA